MMCSDILGWLMDPEVTLASKMLVFFANAKYFSRSSTCKKKKKKRFLVTHRSCLLFCFYLFYLFFLSTISIAGAGSAALCTPQPPSPCLAEVAGPARPWPPPPPPTCPTLAPPSLFLLAFCGAATPRQCCASCTGCLPGGQSGCNALSGRTQVKGVGHTATKAWGGRRYCCCSMGWDCCMQDGWDFPS